MKPSGMGVRGRVTFVTLVGVAILLLAWRWSSSPVRPYNVLLITVDCLRADRLNDARYKSVAPTMHGLARQGMQCTRVWSQCDITMPATRCLFTSQWLHDELNVARTYAIPTLPERLHQNGYQTAGFFSISEYCSGTLIDRLSAGFDVFDGPCEGTDYFRPIEETNARAMAWIRAASTDRPWFAWVMSWELHFRPDRQGVSYDNALAVSDRGVAELMQLLVELGEENNTLVVLTGLHGYNDVEVPASELRDLSEMMLRVPLVLWAPRLIPPQRVNAPLGHIDVMPTVLSLVGVPRPANCRGLDITSYVPPNRPIYAESDRLEARMVVQGSWKLIEYLQNLDLPRSLRTQKLPSDRARPGWVVVHPAHTHRLFDLMFDANERRELTGETATAEKMHERLEAWQDGEPRRGSPPPLTEVQREAMRRHGYWPSAEGR